MDADEIYNWAAFFMLEDKETREKLEKEITLEKQKKLSDEERSKLMIDMFKSITEQKK